MTNDLPTYVVLRTIADDGTRLSHLPTAERIVARLEPSAHMAKWSEAMGICQAIRSAADGWAIAMEEGELYLYEPERALDSALADARKG